MSPANAADATAILEKAQPSVEDAIQLRDTLNADATARRAVSDFIASLPAERDDDVDSKAALKKGIALWASGRERESIDWLASSRARVATTLRANALAGNGHHRSALELIGDDPGDAFEMQTAGEAAADSADLDTTQKLAKAAKKAKYALVAAYLNGRVAELEGDRQAARDAYQEALAAQSGHAPSLFRLGLIEATFGDEEKAVAYFRQCLDAPNPPLNAYLNLGNLYEDLGEFNKARDCYQAVLEVQGDHSRARLFRQDAQASIDMFYDEDMERRADKRSQVLRLPVTDFELSVRSRNCLAKMGVRTLGDLIQRTESELLSYKNFGETSLQEIKDILAQKGLRLGMARDEVGRDDRARSILEGIGSQDSQANMDRPLAELELSVRSRHCMNVLGLKTVGDLANRSEAELMTIKNFGQTSLNEVKQKLAELGLSLASGK